MPDRPSTDRQVWLDGARGTVLAFMLVTPAFGAADASAWQRWLRHSPWDGLTVSDLIFPGFLFLSGASLWFLLRRGVDADVARRLVRRLLALVVLGLVYNAWDLGADLTALRITGVLQTIGVAGALAAVVIAGSRQRRLPVAVVTAAIAIGWGIAVSPACTGPLAPRCSPAFDLDRRFIPDQHLYRQAELGYDPEGLGQMLAATAIVLLGWLAMSLVQRPVLAAVPRATADGGPVLASDVADGRRAPSPDASPSPDVAPGTPPPVADADHGDQRPWTAHERASWWQPLALLAALAAAGVLAGLVDDPNKRLGTTSYVFLTAAAALALLLVFRAAAALEPIRRLQAIPAVLGHNALVVFLGERILTSSLANTDVGGRPAHEWLADRLGADPSWAGLAVGLFVLAVLFAVTGVMHLLRWRLVL